MSHGYDRFVPGILFIAALSLRLIGISSTPIGGDEPFTIHYAQQSWSDLFEMFRYENNPPLFTILLKPWVSLFGVGEWSVRFLPALFSAATAPITYLIGRRYISSQIGFFVAVLFVCSSYHIAFAHEARPYALFGLLTVLSYYFFLQMMLDGKNRLVALAIVNVLLIYNHFLGFVVLISLALAFLLFKDARQNAKPLLISAGLTLVLYLPYLGLFLSRMDVIQSGANWASEPGIEGLYNVLWVFSNEPVVITLFLLTILIGVILLIIRKQQLKLGERFLLFTFLFPYLFSFVVSLNWPFFIDRYLVFVSIPFYLTVGIFLKQIWRKELYLLTSILFLGLAMSSTMKYDAGNKNQDDEFVDYIDSLNGTQSAVVVAPWWYYRTYAYHHDRRGFENYKLTEQLLNEDEIYPRNEFDHELNAICNQKDSIIYIETWTHFSPLDSLKAELASRYNNVDLIESFAPYRILMYSR